MVAGFNIADFEIADNQIQAHRPDDEAKDGRNYPERDISFYRYDTYHKIHGNHYRNDFMEADGCFRISPQHPGGYIKPKTRAIARITKYKTTSPDVSL